MSSVDLIKELRLKTGAGMMECKKALSECEQDIEKAVDYLRKRGIAKAAKRAGREVGEGVVHSYIHANGKIGVLLELNCETDFVAKTDDFKNLAHEISLHVAAASPRYLNQEQVPEEHIEREKEVLKSQAQTEGKPAQVVEKIVEGRIRKFYEENCLLDQPFVKDPERTIQALITEKIAKLGENISVRRFARFQVGEQINS